MTTSNLSAKENLGREAIEGPVEIQIEFQLDTYTLDETDRDDSHAAQAAAGSVSDAAEELEMLAANSQGAFGLALNGDQGLAIGTNLPDPTVEAGVSLLRHLDAIPEKMAFKIGEAAEMVGVKQYVLRYWESEFEMLRPRKSKNNQRVYSRRDVETAMMIKKLLYEDRFSIEGARTALKTLKAQVKEEKGMKVIVQTHEVIVAATLSKLRDLVSDVRRAREMFV